MSHLDEIIENVKTKGSHSESWLVLKNAYYRGDDAPERVKEWAKENGLIVFFDYGGGHPLDSPIQSVIFRRSNPAK